MGEETNKNRISLFLDPKNIMTFELVDNDGEHYNIKIANNEYEFNKPIMIYCEYGISVNFSFVRIFINNKLIGQTKFNFVITLPASLDYRTMTAADIMGKNNAAIAISHLAILKTTLTNKERRGVFNTWKWFYKAENIPIPR